MKLGLQKACVFGTEEKALDAEKGIFGNLSINVVHQFHNAFLGFEVIHYDTSRRMLLNELREVKTSNCKCPCIA